MSFHEILFRIYEEMTTLKERAYYKGNIEWDIKKYSAVHVKWKTQELFEENIHKHKTPIFFNEKIPLGQKKNIDTGHLDHRRISYEAEQTLSGVMQLLGENVSIQVGRSNTDPIHKKQWPQCFFGSVKRAPGTKECDIKYIWEVNRHQFLILLAKAYWLTGEEKYAERICEIITDWIDSNPYHGGVNWTSSLELAVRTISWIWSFSFIKDSQKISGNFYRLFIRSLCEQALYIEKHLSVYSSPYNHLIGEVSALQLIGSFLSHLVADGTRWENLGWHLLSEQAEKQFHEDGFTVEQASFYHHFTLGFYLQAILVRMMNNGAINQSVLKRVESALEFSMYITKPDGTLPMIGDIDNARSLQFGMVHSWDFRGFLGLGALLFNRPDFKYQGDGLTNELFWLSSVEMVADYQEMPISPPSELSKPFYKSGYFVFRDSWEEDSNYLSFDCGDIAHGLFETDIPSAAHGHADALSFELSAYGKSFLVDGGFYTYFGELEWHKYFRTEEAHNTVKIGNNRQAEYCGRLKWQRAKRPRLLSWETNDTYDFVAGEICYAPHVSHQRKILYLKKQCWLCCDFISATDQDIASYLHFDPAVELQISQEQQTIVAANDSVHLNIRYFAETRVHADKGGPEPSDGWVGLGYGIKEPAWRVQFDWDRQEGLYIFPMIIVPWTKQNPILLQFEGFSWGTTEEKIFRASFKINNALYSLIIDENKNITLADQYGTIGIF